MSPELHPRDPSQSIIPDAVVLAQEGDELDRRVPRAQAVREGRARRVEVRLGFRATARVLRAAALLELLDRLEPSRAMELVLGRQLGHLRRTAMRIQN